jgi:hypothetical protein
MLGHSIDSENCEEEVSPKLADLGPAVPPNAFLGYLVFAFILQNLECQS